MVIRLERMSRNRHTRQPSYKWNGLQEVSLSSKTTPGSGEGAAAMPGRGEPENEAVLCFGGYRLQSDGILYRGERVVHLPPKELAALRLLLEHAGQVVSPLQLKKELWDGVQVTADSVLKCMSSLRARLAPEECIQTVYKRGYRLTAELRREHARAGNGLPRLAILPFATGQGVAEHLGSAVAEETMALLAGERQAFVSVLARDSVFMLARRGWTAKEIGERLKADLVLMGTVHALPAHFRLRAEMIEVEGNTQIWVEDLLVPQDRVAGMETELANLLALRLGAAGAYKESEAALAGGLSMAAAAEEKENPRQGEAYETFLRGRHEWQTLERHRMQDGLQYLSRAAELDPSLLAAKVDLAHLCVTQTFYGFMSPRVAAELIYKTSDSIPDFPHQAEAMLSARGWVDFHVGHNLSAALWAFERSAHLPHDPWVTRVRAMFELSRHRFEQAIALMRGTLREDPYSPWLHNLLAWALHLDGQARESVEQIERSIVLFPDHEGTSLFGGLILAYNGEAERAVELAERPAQRMPHFDLATAVHAYTLACAGRRDEARTILERLQWLSRERFVIKSFMPAVHVALGDLDAALAELRAAGEERCPWFFQVLADPRLWPLRERAEFQEMEGILKRMEESAAAEAEPEGERAGSFPS